MKNKIAILFYTKSSRALKNGLLPIYLRIAVDGIRIEISTSKFVEKSKWSIEGAEIFEVVIRDELAVFKIIELEETKEATVGDVNAFLEKNGYNPIDISAFIEKVL
jgi:hypothetical protein